MFKKLFGFGKTSTKTQDPMAVRLGIDTEMCYCPSCGDEYRADIRQCAGCKVALISGEEKLKEARRTIEDFEGRSMEISPDDERVVIRTGKLRDLKPCQILLAKERIPALITGDTGGCAKGWGGPDLQLEVKTADAKQALTIFEQDYLRSTGLSREDLSTAEVILDEAGAPAICPACGTSFIPDENATCPECELSFGWYREESLPVRTQ